MNLTCRAFVKSSAIVAGAMIVPIDIKLNNQVVGTHIMRIYDNPMLERSGLLCELHGIRFNKAHDSKIEMTESVRGTVLKGGSAEWFSLETIHGDKVFIGDIGDRFPAKLMLANKNLIKDQPVILDHMMFEIKYPGDQSETEQYPRAT